MVTLLRDGRQRGSPWPLCPCRRSHCGKGRFNDPLVPLVGGCFRMHHPKDTERRKLVDFIYTEMDFDSTLLRLVLVRFCFCNIERYWDEYFERGMSGFYSCL